MRKTIEIKDGLGLVELKWNGSLSSLQFYNPLSLHWHDCMGSLGKFFIILPYNKEYRKEIQQRVTKSINNGFQLSEEDLQPIFEILQLFENASYEVSYEPEYRYEVDDSWDWEIRGNKKDTSTNLSKFETINAKTPDDVKKIYSVTESFYDGNNESFLFSQPLEIIDSERVSYYEELIRSGLRPTAIIFYGLLEESGIYEDGERWNSTERSGLYILDGHHKLIAYKNLNKTPSLLRIVKRYNSKNDFNLSRIEFDNEIKNHLFKPQIKHINQNCCLR